MKFRNISRRFGSYSLRFATCMADGDGGDAGGGSGDAGGAGDGAGAGDGGDGSGGDGGAGDGNGDAGVVDYFGTAPEDWRSQALTKAGFEPGEDFDKALKQLERVSDIGTFTKNYLSAQDKIRSGEISNGLPENPTDEQMAAYREANGIPATPEDYQVQLEDGLVLGEADERIMGEIYKVAHENNIPSEAMSAMTNMMLQGRQAEADARISQDGVDQQTTDRQLKEAWGGDYQTNVNMVKGLINQLPESVKEAFESARLPDGKAVFNSPEIMIAMADWSRKINPAATVVPNSANAMQTIKDEIAELESKMGTPEWYQDKDAQKRYQDLITAQQQMAAS